MLKSNNTKKSAVILVVALLAAVMTLGPAVSNFQSALAHYGVNKDDCKDDKDYYEDHEEACDKNLKKHYGDDYDGNSASQGIGQSQSSKQNSQCVSGDDTDDSCNNFSYQNQENSGNNAAAQSSGNDDDDDDYDDHDYKNKHNDDDDGNGNSASQGIGQSQSSKQNSQVVSGDDTDDSGNNFSFQNQENSGNNALAQQD
jgi:hypothetical protein